MRGAGIIGNHKYNAGYFLIYRHLNLLRCAFNIMGYAVGLAVNRSCRVRNIDIKLCGLVFKSCVNYYIVDIVKSVQLIKNTYIIRIFPVKRTPHFKIICNIPVNCKFGSVRICRLKSIVFRKCAGRYILSNRRIRVKMTLYKVCRVRVG